MSSKREEERNEKIVKGLLKLPPNRRCINCNNLGPQYVCTNFWTFICITCSGIHREFTHRVKSVSMSKFTSQEVDSLQKGGNQRARELFLKAWDPQRDRLPDNSNVDKVREFIKNMYVDKKYSLEKSSDKPPKDPQSLRSNEDETRRASSYHSYSQSPPYDFQYEERRYGKQHAHSLTRKPGSDRGIRAGKLVSFLSPTWFGDTGNDDRFGNEGSSCPRLSDYSVSGGADPLKSDVLSLSSQRETYTKGTASSGSFGSFEISDNKSPSSLSLPQPSFPGTFDGLDLFSTPFAPQNVASTPPTDTYSQSPHSSSDSSVTAVPHSTLPPVSTFIEQRPTEIPQTSQLDLFAPVSQLQSATSSTGKTSDVNNGGWATFDTASNDNSAPVAVQPSDGNVIRNFNPFSIDQSSSYQGHEQSSASTNTFGHESLQSFEATISNTHLWNAFGGSAEEQRIENVLESNEKEVALHCASDADKFPGFSVYEVTKNNANVRTPNESESQQSVLPAHFSMATNDVFPLVSPLDVIHTFAPDHNPINPFDLPYDSHMESSYTLWNMSSLEAALPNNQAASSYVGGVNQSWFPQNSVPSYINIPGGVPFDTISRSLGFIAGTPISQIPNAHAQGGTVASVGGNPFA